MLYFVHILAEDERHDRFIISQSKTGS